MVLEDYGTLVSNARHFRLVEHGFPVEDDGDGFSFHGDFHFVPLSDRFVCVYLGQGSFPQDGILAFMEGPKLSRSARPTPQVDLRFATSSNEDSRVRIFDGPGHWLSVGVYLLVPVLIEDFRVVRRACGSLEPPVQLEGVIGETFLGRQVSAFGFVVDDSVDDLPGMFAFG